MAQDSNNNISTNSADTSEIPNGSFSVNANETLTNPPDVSQKISGECFICIPCNLTCFGRIPFETHINGEQHLQVCGSKTSFECCTCKSSLNSKLSYDSHVNGAKHKRKLEQLSQAVLPPPPVTEPHSDPILNTSASVIGSCGTNTSTEEFKCILCDLLCSSNEQLLTHLNGKKHARRAKLEAASLVESAIPREDKIQMDFASDNTKTTKAHRKRALISYTKSQMEGGLDGLREAELLLTSSMMNPMLMQLPSCLHRDKTNSDVAEPEAKRSTLDSSLVSNDKPFCEHLKCMVARGLKFYELSLHAISSAKSNNTGEDSEKRV